MPTLKEIRQRLGWAVDQLENFIQTAGGQVPQDPPTDSALYHVQTARAGLEEHIGADDTSDGTTEPEPTPEPTDGAAIVDDPDAFSSSEEVRRNGYHQDQNIHLDTEVARPGGTQSIRYDYEALGVGNSISMGRRLAFDSGVKEVWIETQVRWSENFFAIQNFPQDGSTFAHKFLFGEAKAFATDPNWETSEGWSVTRWSLLFPGGGSPDPPNGPVTAEVPRLADGGKIVQNTGTGVASYYDGNWHTIRLHWSSDPGRYWLEIDGKTIADLSGFTVHPEIAMPAVLLGRNKDDGIESGTESLWWGLTRVWTEDPGW